MNMNTQIQKTELKQNYDQYTPEDFEVWKLLFERQMPILSELAANEYLDGMETIRFKAENIPDFTNVNKIFFSSSGWSVCVVQGLIHRKKFLQMLAQKQFPASTWLRNLNQLDYLPEPDMFHDVFAHLPLLTNPHFCNFFQSIGELGMKYRDHPQILTKIERFYWYTVEFGLIMQNNKLKIYGAGILSSYNETYYSVSNTPRHLAFDPEVIMNTPFDKDKMQDTYFVINSFDELYNSIDSMEKILDKIMKETSSFPVQYHL
jgi:phenylalanine-4-hydroxylase